MTVPDPGAPPVPVPSALIRVDHYSAVQLAADTARRLALRCGLPGALPDRAAVLASELASNLAKHAVQGVLFVHPLPGGTGLELLSADRGPGIGDLDSALEDGWTTTGTLGSGLGAIRRLASGFRVRTEPAGTLISARLGTAGSGGDTGSLCVPADGETACGDAVTLADTDTTRTVLMVDGLGHGPAAEEAAQAAVRAFHRSPDKPLPELLTALHRALRHTRGAAVAALRLGPDGATHCSVGNIRLTVLGFDGVYQRLTGQPGVVGWNLPVPRVERVRPAPGADVAVLHTDGIGHRWSDDPSRFLLRLPPSLLAAALAYGHRRGRDDATVLVTGTTKRAE